MTSTPPKKAKHDPMRNALGQYVGYPGHPGTGRPSNAEVEARRKLEAATEIRKRAEQAEREAIAA